MLWHRSAVGKQTVTHQLWRTKSGDSNNLPLLFDCHLASKIHDPPYLFYNPLKQPNIGCNRGSKIEKKGIPILVWSPSLLHPAFICRYICRSIYLYVCLTINFYLSIDLTISLSICLSIYRSNSLSLYIWLLIKIPLSRNGHSSRIKILLSRNFRELHVYLSRGPCWPTTPLMKVRSPPAKLRQRITDHFLSLLGSLLNMQLASRNPFSGQIFFCKVYWPTPFNMHFDFRPLFRITFAELLRKYPYSQTPAISRGCTEGKAKTRGLGVWLSQSLTFGNLATATRILWCPSPAGHRATVRGSPLHIMIVIPNFRETFAK